jgi:ADP-ribose pyrophosphatase YjhB (NUDIX family)
MKFEELRNYKPKNEQESIDQIAMLEFIKSNGNCLLRDNLVAHFTSSAIIVNQDMNKVLFAYHNIYDSWSWVGGHNDGDDDFLSVSLKEAKEETGVINVKPYDGKIMMIDILPVKRHIKRGKFVPHHLHLNITYLLIADESDQLHIKADENSGVKWFEIDEVLEHVSEEDMEEVYKKAFNYIHSQKLLK